MLSSPSSEVDGGPPVRPLSDAVDVPHKQVTTSQSNTFRSAYSFP